MFTSKSKWILFLALIPFFLTLTHSTFSESSSPKSSLLSSAAPTKNTSHIEEYLQLLHQYPNTLGPFGNAQNGEIEIIKNIPLIQKIEADTGRKVGIIFQDRYWLWINDAVKFPKGSYGVYGRILWRQSLSGLTGVAVLPVLDNGQIALNLNYRHATRSWELELPRGGIEENETALQAAKREVMEETGLEIDSCFYLGTIAPDSGITNTLVPLFLARVSSHQEAHPEESEAIEKILFFSLQEIQQGLLQGYMNVELKGKIQAIPLRDPFLAFSLLQAEWRSLFPHPCSCTEE